MDRTTIIKLVQKELEELGLLLQGFDGMAEIPQPIKTLSISKAEHLLEALRKLEYSRGDGEADKREPVFEEVMVQEAGSAMKEAGGTTKGTENIDTIARPEEEAAQEIETAVPAEEVEELEAEEKPKAKEEVAPVVEAVREVPVEPAVPKQEVHQTENHVKQILGESIHAGVKVGDVLGADSRGSLGSKLEASAIKDLKKAINIGDRFRFQKELFGGNAELMNVTVDKINAASSVEDALELVNRDFNWDSATEATKDFINLILRRFQ